MKVYVLTEDYAYEGSTILGVFARADQGQDFLSKRCGKDVEMIERGDDSDDFICTFDGASGGIEYTLASFEVVDPMPRVRVLRLPDSYRKSCHYTDCDHSPIESVQDRIAHIAAAH